MAECEKKLNVYSDCDEYIDMVRNCDAAVELFTSTSNVLIICKASNCFPDTVNIGMGTEHHFSRVLLLFTTLPIQLGNLAVWKQWIFECGIAEAKIDFLRIGNFDKKYIEGRIQRHCKGWDRKIPAAEAVALKMGDLIETSSSCLAKDSPDLLTTMFGAMGEMIMRVRYVRDRFEKALTTSLLKGKGTIDEVVAKHKKNIVNAIVEGGDTVPEIEQILVTFPKLLLYGETGVGKSLVARFLQESGRPLRISIPEYVGKEEDFEYALFGYAKGAYTGGLEKGSCGLLVENMGKVVFLDEIEEANAVIQAKLLAYLDDYRVRPRGWLHGAFFCPTLIVAATNCSVEELRSRGFRKDLIARFTDIETVPPLRERKESMDFIIDSLLQQNGINFGKGVEKVGKYALEKLKSHPYTNGNFRELEDVLRKACVAAQKDNRDYLCECDIVFD